MPRREPDKMTHLPGTRPTEIEEMAGQILQELAKVALKRLCSGEATAAEQRVALELIRYTGVQDISKDSPVRDLEKKFPFKSLEQEIA